MSTKVNVYQGQSLLLSILMMVNHYEGQPLHYNGKSLCRAIITIL